MDIPIWTTYLHLSSSTMIQTKVVLYNVTCQWSVNLSQHPTQLPSNIWPPTLRNIDFIISKLHIYSHKLNCQTDYSLNYFSDAECIDREGIERTHSNTGLISVSTNHFILCLALANLYWAGILLHKKLMKALVEAKEHKHVFHHFMELQFKDIPNWLGMVTAWEDHTNPNPYVVTKSS